MVSSLLFSALATPARGATLTWTDGSGNFTNPANWSTATAPAPGDTTLFTNDTSYTVTFTADAVNMNSNFFNAQAGAVTLDITGFSWALTNSSVSAGRGAFVVGQAAGSTASVYLAGGSIFVTNANSNTRLLVGGSGVGAFYITNGAVVANRTFLGDTATGVGTLVLSGSGASYSNSSTFYIGNAAGSTGNALILSNSARLTSVSTFILGNSSSSGNSILVDSGGQLITLATGTIIGSGTANNSVTVSGSGSVWTNPNPLRIGSGGLSNSVTISGGGKLFGGGTSGTASSIGLNGTNNFVLITGADSVWRDGYLMVGLGARAVGNTLTIAAGGQVVTTGGGIGIRSGNADVGAVSNKVVITDNGSVWTNTAGFTIGTTTNGAFNSLIITNGGKFYSGGTAASTIGSSLGADNNSVLIADATSLWQVSGSGGFLLGDRGAANSLLVTNGGRINVITGNATLGSNAEGSNNWVVVTGSGSIWSNTALLKVGGSGSSNSFTVSGGASAYSGNGVTIGDSGSFNSLLVSGGGVLTDVGIGRIGETVNASSNTATVTGSGSVWTNTGRMHVGNSGSANRLLVSDGGKVYSAGSGGGHTTVGGSGSNNVAVVTGSGSLWQDGFLAVGDGGSFNSLIVTNNGQVVIATNGGGTLGGGTGASGNSILIADGGVWTNYTAAAASPFSIGAGANASQNSLVLSNGGRMYVNSSVSANLNVGGGAGAHSNSITVTGAGSLWQLNTVGLKMGVLGSGTTLTVSDGGRVFSGANVIGDSGSNNSVVVTGAGSVWSNNAVSGSLILGNSANSIGNGLTISQGGAVYSAGNPGASIGFGVNANSNSVTVTDNGSLWSIVGALQVGSSGAYNRLVVSNGAQVKTTAGVYVGSATTAAINNFIVVTGNGSLLQTDGTVSVGSNTLVNANTRGLGGSILVQDGGTLESDRLVGGENVGGVASGVISNYQGIYQFTDANPQIITNGNNSIAIHNGTISYRDVGAANIFNADVAKITFQGENTFRLNSSSNAVTGQNYSFNNVSGPTNYARLELVNGTTLWRAGQLTVGSGGSLLASNTVGTVAATVISTGSVRVVNSKMTFTSNVVIYGSYVSDPSTNTFEGDLTIASTGAIAGGAGDLFDFKKSFLNGNDSNPTGAFNLASSTVLFSGGTPGTDVIHTNAITGVDLGHNGSNGFANGFTVENFSYGKLTLGSTNDLLVFTSGNAAASNALYVSLLDLSGFSGFYSTISNMVTSLLFAPSNINVYYYYNSSEPPNSYLGGLTYQLASSPGGGAGGLLMPAVPEPSTLLLLTLAACAVLRRRSGSA